MAILTAEALNDALHRLADQGKEAQQHAPALLDTILAKGKPARENLLRGICEEMFHPMKADEIRTLEERVVKLEQQVSAPPPAPEAEAAAPTPAPEEPAA